MVVCRVVRVARLWPQRRTETSWKPICCLPAETVAEVGHVNQGRSASQVTRGFSEGECDTNHIDPPTLEDIKSGSAQRHICATCGPRAGPPTLPDTGGSRWSGAGEHRG